ncbi:MAG TPA: dolichyl-phosphate beta-glucosyltransferase [Candidatus Paceibacterota bacterium]|nr:dolichyl-phosphate beta-glucosyltransferase [Candidatus Paceibacterota bacterium]
MQLSVVIPAYNEEQRIGRTLESVGTWLAAHEKDAEIIVVNNRSTDHTADVVRSYHGQYPFLRIVDEKRPGKGYAVATGMRFATGRIRLFMDADNSTTIDQLAAMRPFLDQGYDVVIGSIGVKGARVLQGGGEPLWRVVFGKMANLWIQLWAVPGVWDTQRGFKVFTARAANDIFSRMTTFGWLFDVEVLAIARARGYRIKEVPVVWDNDPNSKVKLGAYLTSLAESVKITWNRIRGVYRR